MHKVRLARQLPLRHVPASAPGTHWRTCPAANDASLPEHLSVRESRRSPRSRLHAAIAASLIIHLAAAAFAGLTPHPVIDTTPTTLSVRLSKAESVTTVAAATSAVIPTPASAAPETAAESPAKAARFLADPDLSILETIPVTLPGSLTLRLKVSAQGQVEGIAVVRSDPAPKELVDGVIRAFGQARLAPALRGDAPVASSLEVTVRFEPGLVPLDPAQR